ncbi:MAG: YggS family pyridoxal phosphate-dependent enzyme [Opitutales bacterium]
MVKIISENLRLVEKSIRDACERAGRDRTEVTLMAVTKTQSIEVLEAARQAGLELFGENRVQEAVTKREAFAGQARWELIGPLQSNKARLAVRHFDRIQTVDRLKIVEALARLCVDEGRAELPVLLQVNAGEDPAKAGCTVEEAPALAERILAAGPLRLDGLMTIAPFADDPAVARRCFARLRVLRDALRERFGCPLEVLSMGMSGDFAEAIAEGATLIRVGSALFGARESPRADPKS